MQYDDVKKVILKKLETELPKHLFYHSAAHAKDVLKAVINLGKKEKINGDDLIMLKTAALFHDSGFLFGAKNHEANSCKIAKELLPNFKYSNNQIAKICEMIMATKIPQSPKNHLEEILADADLDYLGRDDFFKISNLFFEELAMTGILTNETDWNILQVKFIEKHNYFTKAANKLRRQKKEGHLAIIKSKLSGND
ncbi:MAG: phosphohydrolase [Ferruginibacter sp.]|nr:phosphohydrolase [Ferruginibacter sp.]